MEDSKIPFLLKYFIVIFFPIFIGLISLYFISIENWAESLAEFGGGFGNLIGWAGYLTLFQRITADYFIENFQQNRLPQLLRIASCLLVIISLALSLGINTKYNKKISSYLLTSFAIFLPISYLLFSRFNTAFSSVAYVFYLPSAILFIADKVTQKKQKDFISIQKKITNNITGIFLLIGTLSKPSLATPILLFNPFNNILKGLITTSFLYQISTQIDKPGGGLSSASDSILDLIISLPLITSMAIIKALSGYSIPYSSIDISYELILILALAILFVWISIAAKRFFDKKLNFHKKLNFLLIGLLFASLSVYYLQESIRSGQTGIVNIIKTSFLLIFGDRKSQINLIISPVATYYLILFVTEFYEIQKLKKFFGSLLLGLLLVININSTMNVYVEGNGFSKITSQSINMSRNKGSKFCTFTEPYINWELHPYAKILNEKDVVNASHSWQFGGCFYFSLYNKYSMERRFFEKNYLNEELEKLLKNQSDFFALVTYAERDSDEIKDVFPIDKLLTSEVTKDKYPFKNDLYVIDNLLLRRKIKETFLSNDKNSKYNLNLLEIRKENNKT